MALTIYCAILEKAPGEAAIAIEFPDFEEVASHSPTWQDVSVNAFDALVTAIEARRADGLPIPEPTPIDQVTADWPPVWTRQVLLVTVDIARAPARINIHMDPLLLQRVDVAAEHRGVSRSAYLAEGARKLLEAEPAA